MATTLCDTFPFRVKSVFLENFFILCRCLYLLLLRHTTTNWEQRERSTENWAQQKTRDERRDEKRREMRDKTRDERQVELRWESEKHKKCLPENSAKFSFFPVCFLFLFTLFLPCSLVVSILSVFVCVLSEKYQRVKLNLTWNAMKRNEICAVSRRGSQNEMNWPRSVAKTLLKTLEIMLSKRKIRAGIDGN